MKKVFSACHCAMLRTNQCVGNRVIVDNGTVKCIGGISVLNLVPGLTPAMGVVNVELTIEEKPFKGYSHVLYVYGDTNSRRLSSREPYFSRRKCKDGTRRFFAFGDLWLSLVGNDYFPAHGCEVFPVYVSAVVTDKEEEL